MNSNASTTIKSGFSPITLGEKLKCLENSGFVFTGTAHEPNHKLARHYHERANIAFVLKGSFTEMFDRQRFDCDSQSIIIKPAGEAHANLYGRNGMQCFLIEINPEKLESLHPLTKIFHQVRHLREANLSALFLRLYKEMGVMDSASLIAMEGLTLEIIAEISRRDNRLISERNLPRWLELAKEFLYAHYSQNISITDVAKTVGVHPVHLAREFRRFYGVTPGEYLRRLRIEFSARQLSTSDMPLVEISLAAGFSHQAHFSRVFKRHIGLTPSEFRSLRRQR